MGLKASKIAIDEFTRSAVWADLKDILNERLRANVEELECVNHSEDVWTDIRRVASTRARLGELRFLLALPRFLADQYDNLSKLEEEEEDAG